jgi:hypothetical protein
MQKAAWNVMFPGSQRGDIAVTGAKIKPYPTAMNTVINLILIKKSYMYFILPM